MQSIVDPQVIAERLQASDTMQDRKLLLRLYRSMVLIRIVEEHLASLLEKKLIHCPTHLYTGQEAIAAGVCAVLEKTDYVWGAHRSHGHYLAKGGSTRALMAEIFGKSTGCAHGRGGSMHLFASEVGIFGTVPLVTATIPLAVGAGMASQLRRDGRVSVSFFGDGAAGEGHFHESLNIAALNKLPVIFVCENNFYSSHMHLLECRAEDNIFKAAEAHGMPGVRADGNDVIMVYDTAKQALERARSGGGPTLLEYRTYRWRGHVGPSMDMDVGVKRKDEMKEWLSKDPVARLRSYLIQSGAELKELDQIQAEAEAETNEAVLFAQQSPCPDPSDLLRNIFYSDNGSH